jgi:nucleoside-triphosphatase
MGRTLLLSGLPGVGKTTIIKKVVQALGDRAGGFYTEEILGPGGRKGFRLVTLDGQTATVAHVNLRVHGRPQISRYGVDVNAIEHVGVAALRRVMSRGKNAPARPVCIIDEIGKMELFCGPFKDVVLSAVGGPGRVLATVMAKPNPWVDGLKVLPGVETWKVTKKNRDKLVEKIIEWLER